MLQSQLRLDLGTILWMTLCTTREYPADTISWVAETSGRTVSGRTKLPDRYSGKPRISLISLIRVNATEYGAKP
jgi:hypothetical protein